MPSVGQVELSLYAIALSGLLLWEGLPVSWRVAAPMLVAHIVGGTVLTVLVVAPFWWQHRVRLRTAAPSTRRATGRWIEIVLALLVASGFYLFFAGNDGASDAALAHALHLWLTLPLLAILVLHVARASALRVFWYRARRRRPLSRLRSS